MQAIPLKWAAWCLQGVRVELDVNGSAGWLESEELDVLLLPLLAALAAQAAHRGAVQLTRPPARSAAPRPSWP